MRLVSIMAVLSVIAGVGSPVLAQQSQTGVRCVVPPDSNWRPVSWGFETESHVIARDGAVRRRDYPVLRRIVPGSAADSAGLRDGDVWRAIDGHDWVRQHDQARVRGPGIPARLTIARGDSIFDRIITPGPAKPSSQCPASRP